MAVGLVPDPDRVSGSDLNQLNSRRPGCSTNILIAGGKWQRLLQRKIKIHGVVHGQTMFASKVEHGAPDTLSFVLRPEW
jgi:hypothetical protein